MNISQVAGNPVWMLAPSVQYTNLTYRDRNGIRAYDAGRYACLEATSARSLPPHFR